MAAEGGQPYDEEEVRTLGVGGDDQALLGPQRGLAGSTFASAKKLFSPRRVAAGLALVGLACIAAVAWQHGGRASTQIAKVAPIKSSPAASPFEVKEEEEEEPALEPKKADERNAGRKKLKIESSIGAFVTPKVLLKASSFGSMGLHKGGDPADHCRNQASHLFDAVLKESGLDDELMGEEREAFKARFTSAMQYGCKHDKRFDGKEWIRHAQEALDEEKPVVTHKVAASLNEAKLGFKAEMQPWMVNVSKKDFAARLGRTALPPAKAKELREQGRRHGRSAQVGYYPERHDSREKWPECKEVIGKIHNQGTCGSCWVFGALGALDSRLCIKSKGKFKGDNAVLSRGFAASCATSGDGCHGGWEYFVYEWMEKKSSPGAVSDKCSHYFAYGEGVDHFDQTMRAPTCPLSCKAGYSRTPKEDGFKLRGIGNYRLIMANEPNMVAEAKAALFHHGPIPFGIYASREFMGYKNGIYSMYCGQGANHAVHMIGYEKDCFIGQNSWGEHWGDHGRFKIAPCAVTDVTLPGDFDIDHFPFPLGDFNPPNPKSPLPCLMDKDGCYTSPNFPMSYDPDQKCKIPKEIGPLYFEEFNTELEYDILTINGVDYSGTKLPPQGIKPTEDIFWHSDQSVNAKGWKLCGMSTAK